MVISIIYYPHQHNKTERELNCKYAIDIDIHRE